MSLQRITLRDFVIVPALELDLQTGFGALTGETGAGKSILIDALQLAMGARADASVVREGCERADIAAHFALCAHVQPLLAQYGFDADTDSGILLRRSIDAQGKSRAWVNGVPATAAQLRAIGALLVDIYGQHAWQSLLSPAGMRALLDAYANVDGAPLRALWQQAQSASLALQAAREQGAANDALRERLQWQIEETARLAPLEDEWEALCVQQQRLSSVQALLEAAHGAHQALEAEDGGALHALHRAASLLQAHGAIESAFAEATDLLVAAHANAHEAARSLQHYLHHNDPDPQRLAAVDERMAQWMGLARRWRCTPAELPAQLAQWRVQLSELEAAAQIDTLEAAAQAAQRAYEAAAAQVSAQRRNAAAPLSSAVTAAMQQLGMAGGAFEVCVDAAPAGPTGVDAAEFLVRAHASSSLRPVAKVASGGELSRIALAIAVTTSEPGQAPTLIFDEVDAGVGGAVAHSVGRLMQQLGRSRQVLAVTHLPQVAACAHHHLLVSKSAPAADAAPSSSVRELSEAQRIDELARMMGGERITAATRAHAQELWQQSQIAAS